MTPELKLALEVVQKHFPSVSMVVFNIQGQWQYMSSDFESPDFEDKIDVDLLEKASDSIYSAYGFPYVYQEPESLVLDCPICGCALTQYIEDSDVIRECEGCGAEWEADTGDITLDPREL